ncbi:MAG: hypothetical protein ABJN65_04690 [Parasphingorhabdus sp.]
MGPQAPGADIRPLGYPRFAADARSRLPLLCNGALAFQRAVEIASLSCHSRLRGNDKVGEFPFASSEVEMLLFVTTVSRLCSTRTVGNDNLIHTKLPIQVARPPAIV